MWALRARQFLHSTDIATSPPRKVAWGPFPMEVTSLELGKMKWWAVEVGMKSQTLPFRTKWADVICPVCLLLLVPRLVWLLVTVRGTGKGCKRKHPSSWSKSEKRIPFKGLFFMKSSEILICWWNPASTGCSACGVLVALETRQLLEGSTNPRGTHRFWKTSVGLSNLFDG